MWDHFIKLILRQFSFFLQFFLIIIIWKTLTKHWALRITLYSWGMWVISLRPGCLSNFAPFHTRLLPFPGNTISAHCSSIHSCYALPQSSKPTAACSKLQNTWNFFFDLQTSLLHPCYMVLLRCAAIHAWCILHPREPSLYISQALFCSLGGLLCSEGNTASFGWTSQKMIQKSKGRMSNPH